MTNEEIAQVQTYIADLTKKHTLQLAEIQQKILDLGVKYDKAEKFNKQCRHEAYHERDMANTAIGQIVELCKGEPTLVPSELAGKVKQIIDYYCPDWDIPF